MILSKLMEKQSVIDDNDDDIDNDDYTMMM